MKYFQSGYLLKKKLLNSLTIISSVDSVEKTEFSQEDKFLSYFYQLFVECSIECLRLRDVSALQMDIKWLKIVWLGGVFKNNKIV